MNGYSENQIKELVTMANTVKNQGGSLTEVFGEFAQKYGKAQGSVRNFFYSLMYKANDGDYNSKKYFENTNLKANKIVKFSLEEERWLLKNVLRETSYGKSVRKVIYGLSGGDAELALRYQNKYRNLIKNDKKAVAEIMSELNAEGVDTSRIVKKRAVKEEFIYKKLCGEINNLVDRIGDDTKKENLRLTQKLAELENENKRLRAMVVSTNESPAIKYLKKNSSNKNSLVK